MKKMLHELMDGIKDFWKETNQRFENTEAWQKNTDTWKENTNKHLSNIEIWQQDTDAWKEKTDERFDQTAQHLVKLEEGQIQIRKDLQENYRHLGTLMSENFALIRRDFWKKDEATQSDLNLLFTEVTDIKRKVTKI